MVIKILNLDKCIKKFGDISKIDIMPVIKYGAAKVQATAKDLAPVDTGTLKGSIFRKSYPKQQSAIVYTATEYAPYQEYGTTKIPANPFMTPAMNMNRAGIVQVMNRFIKEKMKNPQGFFQFPQSEERAGRDFIYVKTSGGKVTKEKKQPGEKRLRKNILRNKSL